MNAAIDQTCVKMAHVEISRELISATATQDISGVWMERSVKVNRRSIIFFNFENQRRVNVVLSANQMQN